MGYYTDKTLKALDKRTRRANIIKWSVLVGIAVIILLSVGACTNRQSFHRWWKSTKSEYTGGLDRTVSVYSYDGELIKSWTGKFDVTDNDNETFFDIDGKRVIIQGGIIINEEN